MKIQGAVALITGAAEGFGKAFSEELLKRSARGIGIVDFNAAKGKATETELNKKYGEDKVRFFQCDVSSKDQLEDAFSKTLEHYKGIDIVCNNAGIGDELNWEKTVDVDLVAVMRGTFLAKQYMDKNKGGRGGIVINIASMAGLYPMPLAPAYSAAKHGVLGFSRALAIADKVFNPENVRLNCLCPSFSETAILQQMKGLINHNPVAEAIYGAELQTVPVSMVAEGFIQLVEDDSKHGEVMRCTPQNGIDYKKFRDISKL
ncbi:15-hydroxyprostaglandin dehydrogenase [NAD(+)] isoform X1 [Strongylocentrotus purpuratus]|uniref:15-hydroxyprostaglandin dehydrogenase [NAD(+)] n=1 Tax=Strongylocentrotus purpuratus TaxID=7668 RepID=A0A7M7HNP0_STRPU|nr:15-hydroxyprostaglandin dehydrogenase [NAD(+)] isoform X1 [Strongylocentrotus purpuratus]XP_011681272.1 15-hydroxyprostaglandin dehydrogenase [NAD(+)] isoform X1 [Strongylocentrotus purpuratus]|eukprot:XP_011681271.1 PREDICTED: 15-hydroxyprostaglandin dehydrogenase [NAD(+)] isoform X2 [Strongylocentrotus purpuratus]